MQPSYLIGQSFYIRFDWMRKQRQNSHPKAEASKSRKADKKTANYLVEEATRLDEYWKDDDKLSQRKAQRKAGKETKRLDDIHKKSELKRLVAEDSELVVGQLKHKSKVPSEKITQAQIQTNLSSDVPVETPVTIVTDLELKENYNHTINKLEPGGGDARSVEQAILMLKTDSSSEKKSQAAFAKFEREQLPLLRDKYPSLRLTQVKQLLWKEWERSPDNPHN